MSVAMLKNPQKMSHHELKVVAAAAINVLNKRYGRNPAALNSAYDHLYSTLRQEVIAPRK